MSEPAQRTWSLQENVALGPMTTLGVGGAARRLVELANEAELIDCLHESKRSREPALLLGGGSNVLIADRGVPGWVMRLNDRRIRIEREGNEVHLSVGAGLSWDDLVARTVVEGWAGIECLSGIPGRVGAAPIQNIGAYGQELAERCTWVRVVEQRTGRISCLKAAECGFGYRGSIFKGRARGRYGITQVGLTLSTSGKPTLRYPELRRVLGVQKEAPDLSLSEVRAAVLTLRRRKSMVLDPSDPNTRSAGSFFMNPVLEATELPNLRMRLAARHGAIEDMPVYPTEDSPKGGAARLKLSAAWLMERSGFSKGHIFNQTQGRVALSTNHVLALINREDARAEDFVLAAGVVQRQVAERTGIALEPEPVFIGFE